MKKSKTSVGRRGFLKGAAVGAAAIAATPLAKAQQPATRAGTAALPSTTALAAATSTAPPALEVLTADRPGSDFMLDVLKSLGFEYIAANPGSSFRALHESVLNYGGDKKTQLMRCCDERW